jgi:type I restriction enzyme M protein
MASRAAKNKYCLSSDLSNEASVESFFVLRLLEDLGYADREIKTKERIDQRRIPKGSRRELYRPDYLLVCGKHPRWLIDAKSPDERIEDYTYQGAGYALQVNRRDKTKPLRYYMLTNGLLTRVYVWDQEEAVLSLRFRDFVDGNTKFEALQHLLGAEEARKGWGGAKKDKPAGHKLERPEMDAVKKAFNRCHRIIWSTEKMSPQAAFVEFAKLLFVKLWEDRRLRDDPETLEQISKDGQVPQTQVRFSTRWILESEEYESNPVDTLLFRRLVEQLEDDISKRKRKRIFETSERLRLSPGTIRRVVKELEHYYLFGIDEDLNGRMFEAFLVATMRGQDLGQYFTPRSVVKVMTRLAKLHAGPGEDGIDRVLDACCGTGGFLIEALTEMRKQVWDNNSLTKAEQEALLQEVSNEAIFGIDAGRDPAVARIARINMYLHGDGGSRVYMTDALRHPPEASEADSREVKREVDELRKALKDGLQFDCVLTNPPFSMSYSANVPEEKEVLDTYELADYGGKRKASLRSSVMFLERYSELLRPGGRLLTVLDDSVLGGKNYAEVRQFIYDHFTIRAIISLHGDAFQRAGARAKTSILYLTKKKSEADAQPSAFVYESRYIGLDDVVSRTRPSVAAKAKEQAEKEMNEIVEAFNEFLDGKDGPWLVSAEKLSGRLDAKHLKPWSASELRGSWEEAGASTVELQELVDLVEEPVKLDSDTLYGFLRISYEGKAEMGEQALGKEVSYTHIGRAKAGDIVVSNISAVYRAICVMPADSDLLVSNEFTVLRLKKSAKADPLYLWSVLRSSAVIAEWMSGSSGVGRHRVGWELLKEQQIPILPYREQKKVGDLLRRAQARDEEIAKLRASAESALDPLGLEGDEPRDRLIRAKPPR